MTEVFEKLRDFTIQHTLIEDYDFKRSTSIEEDLGITGDDARDYLNSFSAEFDVDISEFPINDFFEEEGSTVLSWFKNLFSKVQKKKNDLTLGDLEISILEGKLRPKK